MVESEVEPKFLLALMISPSVVTEERLDWGDSDKI